MREKNRKPNRLPVVRWRDRDCFFDERLKQLRAVDNPHDFVELSDEEVAAIKTDLKKRGGERA